MMSIAVDRPLISMSVPASEQPADDLLRNSAFLRSDLDRRRDQQGESRRHDPGRSPLQDRRPAMAPPCDAPRPARRGLGPTVGEPNDDTRAPLPRSTTKPR